MTEPLLPEPTVRPLLRQPGTRRRLLLIDDELSVARFIAHAAEECGYEAIITVTARYWLRKLSAVTVMIAS